MDFRQFQDTLTSPTPPEVSPALQALWHDGKGDWQAAHEQLQDQNDRDGAWVHAYLHRKEGDLSNAAYWYRRAGQPTALEPVAKPLGNTKIAGRKRRLSLKTKGLFRTLVRTQ